MIQTHSIKQIVVPVAQCQLTLGNLKLIQNRLTAVRGPQDLSLNLHAPFLMSFCLSDKLHFVRRAFVW